MAAVSRYKDFELNGVINRERLETFENGRFKDDWSLVPLDLTKGVEGFGRLGWLFSLVPAANAVFLVFLVRRIPSRRANEESETELRP